MSRPVPSCTRLIGPRRLPGSPRAGERGSYSRLLRPGAPKRQARWENEALAPMGMQPDRRALASSLRRSLRGRKGARSEWIGTIALRSARALRPAPRASRSSTTGARPRGRLRADAGVPHGERQQGAHSALRRRPRRSVLAVDAGRRALLSLASGAPAGADSTRPRPGMVHARGDAARSLSVGSEPRSAGRERRWRTSPPGRAQSLRFFTVVFGAHPHFAR